MEQYISKDTLVAEINERIKLNDSCIEISKGNDEFYRGAFDEAKEILSLIDTIEVKEIEQKSSPSHHEVDEGHNRESTWSEEDELNFNQAIYVCHQHGYFEVETWLKSLKFKNTLKLNDRELEVLRLTAEKDGTCLMGLYEKLKKLR